MRREDRMVSREGVIERSLSSQPTGWTAEKRRKTKRAKTLLVCAAAVLTLLSAAVLLSAGDRNEESIPSPEIPASSAEDPPGTPYPVGGYVYESGGVTPVMGAAVTVTNVNTGFSWLTTSSLTTGFYSIVIYATAGDLIHAEAVLGDYMGENEAVASGSFMNLPVTLDTLIPEFTMVAVPVVGMMMVLLAVAGIRRRRRTRP